MLKSVLKKIQRNYSSPFKKMNLRSLGKVKDLLNRDKQFLFVNEKIVFHKV